MQDKLVEQAEMNIPSAAERTLCNAFVKDLNTGFLSAVRDKVAQDDTLMIGLRGASINLYYRGGSIMKLMRLADGLYDASFDAAYGKSEQIAIPSLPRKITNAYDCCKWVSALPTLKEIMNGYFVGRPKAEREFQQLVVWENNRSTVSNETEYFITDIEFASEARDARIDMLGLKWRANDRKSGSRCAPVLIEMKWGDDALGGSAGIAEHLRAIKGILNNGNELTKIRETIGQQFEQLRTLGLVSYNRSSAVTEIVLSEPPEVVFILANHNPRSEKLHNILKTVEEPEGFNLRFFVASFSGYGMHDACMLNLSQFKTLVASYLKNRDQPQLALATD